MSTFFLLYNLVMNRSIRKLKFQNLQNSAFTFQRSKLETKEKLFFRKTFTGEYCVTIWGDLEVEWERTLFSLGNLVRQTFFASQQSEM